MRKLKLYIAMSLNGKIADLDGNVHWLESLPNPDKIDHDYASFYETIDTTIQGYSTYAQIMSWGIDFPYAGKENYVFTRKQELENTTHVEFVANDHLNFVQQLKEQAGKDIWLIGGGQINTLLFNEGLIDELQVFVMPIVLAGGIDLFAALPKETLLQLIKTKSYSTGATLLEYQVKEKD